MTLRSNPIAPQATLGDQLKRKSRSRRGDLKRLAQVSTARRRNDMLPRLELTYVPIDELRPSAGKLRKLDSAHA